MPLELRCGTQMRIQHAVPKRLARLCRRSVICASSKLSKPIPSPDGTSVVVVGGGAAGLTAAFFAAQEGGKVTVLERTREAGKKILMSGGTRCNVLPVEVDLQRDYFTDSSKSAMRAVFSSWSLWECKYWLEDRGEGVGLELVEDEETAKYFPASNSGRDVRDHLVRACGRLGVRFEYDASVEDMSRTEGGRWSCRLRDGREVTADRVVVATGGLSFPAVGTDGTGLRILKGLGHSLKELYPALTPLKGSHPGGENLAGLSQYSVRLSCQTGKKLKSAQQAQRGGFLFTHKGYSGPSILDLSHHAVLALQRGQAALPVLRANWTGESVEEWEERLLGLQGSSMLLSTALKRAGLRERLADALCRQLGLEERLGRELRKGERQQLLQLLTSYPLPYDGHEGYKKAEVTGGGVPLSEVDCATMESRVLPGLHLCGEVLDVFGRIGGFNFYWAWVSGRLAGLGTAKCVQQESQESASRSPAAAAS